MEKNDCRRMAEEWVDHVVRQYGMAHVCRKELSLIQYLLQKGFTLIAVRDGAKVLRVNFLTKKSPKKRESQANLHDDRGPR